MPTPPVSPTTVGSVPELSMVVPAFRQSATIEADVARIHAVIDRLTAGAFELIVVVDGFVDDSLERAAALALPKTTVAGYATNIGKGHAVRYGMQRASGQYVGFIDAGMDIDPSAIEPALQAMRHGADAAIGSKLHPHARTSYPAARRVYSKGYQVLTWLLFRLSVRDTQVGLKMFRSDQLLPILPRLLVKRFAFDVELLVALSHNHASLRIVEVPVTIQRESYFQSSVNFTAVRSVFLDTIAIWYRANLRRTYG